MLLHDIAHAPSLQHRVSLFGSSLPLLRPSPALHPSLGMAEHSPTFGPARVRLMNSIHQSPVPLIAANPPRRCLALPALRCGRGRSLGEQPSFMFRQNRRDSPRKRTASARNDASSAPGLVTAVMDGVSAVGGEEAKRMRTVRTEGLYLKCTVVFLCRGRGRGRLNDACRFGDPRNWPQSHFSPSCCSMGAEEKWERRSVTNCQAAQGIRTGAVGGGGCGGWRDSEEGPFGGDRSIN